MALTLDVVDDEGRLRGGLSPLRRRVLEELREPASATGIAARLGESRQRVNYHLRELEKAGLAELAEVRQRRGRTERIMRPTARTVVVAPRVIGATRPEDQDRFAVDTLLDATARTFTDVARMRSRARSAGKRLVTFTVEADVGFTRPADIERFASRLADQVAALVAEFDAPAGRRYHVAFTGHPAAPEPAEPVAKPPHRTEQSG
jgi:DNA-binding transcriptional ArsR family regulator